MKQNRPSRVLDSTQLASHPTSPATGIRAPPFGAVPGRKPGAPAHARPRTRRQGAGFLGFLTAHKLMASTLAGLLVVATVVSAAVLWRQDVAFTNASQDSDITFVDGGGGLTGFATLALGTGATSATLTLTGVAGVAAFQVTGLLQIDNAAVAQDYEITLSRSAAPNAAIDSLTFTVLDGVSTVETFDAKNTASATAFTLPAGDTYDIRIDMTIAAGTVAGSLGALNLQFTISPL